VATLIVVLSVMGGFRASLISRLIGMNGHVVITARDGMLQTTPELLRRCASVPDVKTVRLTLERQALVSADGQTRGALLRGVRLEDLTSRDIVTKNIVTASSAPSAPAGRGDGRAPAPGAGHAAGDKITVTPTAERVGTIAPRYSDYELLASFLTKRYEFDSALVFMPLQMLQEDLEVRPSHRELDRPRPRRSQRAPQVPRDRASRSKRDDLKVADWQTLNARFVGALQVERVMMFIILTLIVLVAAMNVVASFTMLVRVKRGSIAILRTMGRAGHDRARLLPVGRGGRHRRHRAGHRARPADLRQHCRRSPTLRRPLKGSCDARSSSSPRRRCASSRARC
jgi:lipoprotein-releasing system permease protein